MRKFWIVLNQNTGTVGWKEVLVSQVPKLEFSLQIRRMMIYKKKNKKMGYACKQDISTHQINTTKNDQSTIGQRILRF